MPRNIAPGLRSPSRQADISASGSGQPAGSGASPPTARFGAAGSPWLGAPGLRGPRALEELALLLVSTGELTAADLQRLPPRPRPADRPLAWPFTGVSGGRARQRAARCPPMRGPIVMTAGHPLEADGAVPQTAAIPFVTRRYSSGLLNVATHSPEDSHGDRKCRSARLQRTRPKGLFQCRTADPAQLALTGATYRVSPGSWLVFARDAEYALPGCAARSEGGAQIGALFRSRLGQAGARDCAGWYLVRSEGLNRSSDI
jgi:hypothetical protein